MSSKDLSATYLGKKLTSPFVVSSCPLTGDLDSARRLEAAGAGAIVLPSLFQEQMEHEELEFGRLHAYGAESFPEATAYFPALQTYNTGPDGYLKLVEQMCAALKIPVFASLNGVSARGWARHAKLIEEAGADALELNLLHVPTDPDQTAAVVEALYVEQVAAVTQAVKIPVAVKVGSHLSAPANFARQIQDAGASAMVLFNRFLEPDIDLETFEVVPHLELSSPVEMHMPLRWIAIIDPWTELDLAATGGAHDAEDSVKLLVAGADVVMLASVLLVHGPAHLENMLCELTAWLEENEFDSVQQMKGSMNHRNCPDPASYERLNYMRALTSFTARH